jgi:hypothetical protein
MDDEVPRRTYLNSLLATGLAASIAGCNTSSDGSDSKSTTERTSAAPNQAPKILAHDATPKNNGTALTVSLEGEADQELSLARIEYGGKAVEKSPEDTSVTLSDEFTELGAGELTETPGQATFLLRDTDGKETRAAVSPDETAPQLQTFAAEPTTNAGEIALRLDGRDDTGLGKVQFHLGEQPYLQTNAAGQQAYSTEQRVSVSKSASLQHSPATASLADWNGNTTEAEAETYVRKYDRIEEPRRDVGVLYVPWARGGNHCLADIDSEAAIGAYGNPIISSETTDKHIDQMTGHGINRVMFNYKGFENVRDELTEFLKSSLVNQIEIEAFYPVKNKRWVDGKDWREDILAPDMTDLKNRILSRSNCATYNGRQILHIWNAHQLSQWGPEKYRRNIMEEWGSYETFVSDMRSYLTVDDTEPFLIANILGAGVYGLEESDTGMPPMTKLFDGVSTWTASGVLDSGSAVDWASAMEFVEANYEGALSYAARNEMEFIPMVFPGFDDRANHCWGRDRYIPRSLEKFDEMLALAEEYATTDMIDVATWNDWPEGHQIEPGTWRGNEYGSEYLESIQRFQSPSS